MSIRIHDYSKIVIVDSSSGPQRRVSETYAQIGVRIDWRARIRPAEIEAGRGAMAERRCRVCHRGHPVAGDGGSPEPATGIAGYAPITRERGGRIAYVVGDRTRLIARRGRVAQSSVLAGVIAHELAHLLMPPRSHSTEGVMRANWDPPDFKYITQERFSDIEAASIRQAARRMSSGPSGLAD